MFRKSSIKVGVLAIISLLLLVFVLVWLRGRGLQSGTSYQVRFADIDGMREGAAVQMMGIRVGFVDHITLERTIDNRYYVNVTFTISNENAHMMPGSKISVEQSGLIGEKFLEVTPPQLQVITLTTFDTIDRLVQTGMPVKFIYETGPMVVGHVERVERMADENMVHEKLYFRITRPGALMPETPVYELVSSGNNGIYLRITPQTLAFLPPPDKNLFFTVENPMRMKQFLQIQLDSAEALKETNDKINQLLSDETITSLKNTLKNTEVLTARTTEVLDTANTLFQSAHQDLENLVSTTNTLSTSLTKASNNLNSLIGDPRFKQQLLEATTSLQQSATALKGVLSDPDLKQTLALTKDTTQNTAELASLLRKTAEDKDLQNRLNQALNLVNDSLGKLSTVLGNVNQLTTPPAPGQPANPNAGSVTQILKDSEETSKNLKEFSQKLNQHFLLFRLMF